MFIETFSNAGILSYLVLLWNDFVILIFMSHFPKTVDFFCIKVATKEQ